MTRIAVVNDDTDFLTLMQELLDLRGWKAEVIRESKSAVAEIRNSPPDLVIMDVRMDSPETGWQIVDVLKLDPATRHIPIIICSADMAALRDKAEWLAEHGIGALPKPFDMDDLYASVEAALLTGQPLRLGLG